MSVRPVGAQANWVCAPTGTGPCPPHHISSIGPLDERTMRDTPPGHCGILIGPADRAGLRAGDVIVRLDGRSTRSEAAFGDVLARLRPGERVSVTVVGQGGERTVTVTLGELPVR